MLKSEVNVVSPNRPSMHRERSVRLSMHVHKALVTTQSRQTRLFSQDLTVESTISKPTNSQLSASELVLTAEAGSYRLVTAGSTRCAALGSRSGHSCRESSGTSFEVAVACHERNSSITVGLSFYTRKRPDQPKSSSITEKCCSSKNISAEPSSNLSKHNNSQRAVDFCGPRRCSESANVHLGRVWFASGVAVI